MHTKFTLTKEKKLIGNNRKKEKKFLLYNRREKII